MNCTLAFPETGKATFALLNERHMSMPNRKNRIKRSETVLNMYQKRNGFSLVYGFLLLNSTSQTWAYFRLHTEVEFTLRKF